MKSKWISQDHYAVAAKIAKGTSRCFASIKSLSLVLPHIELCFQRGSLCLMVLAVSLKWQLLHASATGHTEH